MNLSTILSSGHGGFPGDDISSYNSFRDRLEAQPRYYGEEAAVSTRQPTRWGQYPAADHRAYSDYTQQMIDDYEDLDEDQDYDSLALPADYDDFMYELFLNPQFYGHDGAMSHLVPLVRELNVSFLECQERFKDTSYLRSMIARNMQKEAQDMHTLSVQLQSLEIEGAAIDSARQDLYEGIAQEASIPAPMLAAPPIPEEMRKDMCWLRAHGLLKYSETSFAERQRAYQEELERMRRLAPWYRKAIENVGRKNAMMKKLRKFLDKRAERR